MTRRRAPGSSGSTDGGASWIRLGSGYPPGISGDACQFYDQNLNVDHRRPGRLPSVYRRLQSAGASDRWTAGATGAPSEPQRGRRALPRPRPVLPRQCPRPLRRHQRARCVPSTDGGQNWTTSSTPTRRRSAPRRAGAGFGKVVVALAPPTSRRTRPASRCSTWPCGNGRGARSRRSVPEHRPRANGPNRPRPGSRPNPGRLQLPHGRRPRLAGRRRKRHHLPRVCRPGPLDGLGRDLHRAGRPARRHPRLGVRPQPAATPSTVYCGNDGGIFRSTDDGTTWTALNSGGLQTALFYNLAASPDDGGTELLGALQDNGVQTTAGAASPGWNSPQGGDGWDVAFDGVTAGRAYGTSGFWSPAPCTRVWRSDDDGASWPTEVTPWGTTSDEGCYLASIARPERRRAGLREREPEPVAEPERRQRRGATSGLPGNASVARQRQQRRGGGGNRVLVTTNALAARWRAHRSDVHGHHPQPAERTVLRAAFDPNDPTVIYAVLGGFNGVGPAQRGHVFRTTIGGTAWKDISPDLDVPFGALALDGADTPTTIYVGTDLGVLRSVDDGRPGPCSTTCTSPGPRHRPGALRRVGCSGPRPTGAASSSSATRKGPRSRSTWRTASTSARSARAGSATLQVFNVGVTDSSSPASAAHGLHRLHGPAAPGARGDRPGRGDRLHDRVHPDDAGHDRDPRPSGSSATIRRAVVDLVATGTAGAPSLEVAVPDSGDFGDVCLGSFVDRDADFANRGPCPTRHRGHLVDTQFIPPGVTSSPTSWAAGLTTVPIRPADAFVRARGR